MIFKKEEKKGSETGKILFIEENYSQAIFSSSKKTVFSYNHTI